MVLLGLTHPHCTFWPFTWASELFTMAKQKQESKRCHQPRASNRLKRHFSLPSTSLIPATGFCPATKPRQHQQGTPHWHITQASTHRAANSKQEFWLYPHPPHVYDALKLIQIISAPHSPTDKSPNPFKMKTQQLWLQSSSSISSSIAKLYAIKQPNVSTLLVILLLQHCKRKNVGGFLWQSCHCLEETCVLHTQNGTHVFHMVHCKLHGIESSWRKMAVEKWFSWASSVDLFCL